MRQPRVPVRWGFVLMSGIVVLTVIGAAIHYGSGAVSGSPEFQKNAVGFIKRVLTP